MYPLYAGLYFALASTWFSSARPQLSILYLSFADLLLMRVLHLSGDFPKWLFWRPDSPLVLLDSLLHWWILSATREVRWVRGWRMQYWIAAQLVFRLGRLLSRVFRGIEVGGTLMHIILWSRRKQACSGASFIGRYTDSLPSMTISLLGSLLTGHSPRSLRPTPTFRPRRRFSPLLERIPRRNSLQSLQFFHRREHP